MQVPSKTILPSLHAVWREIKHKTFAILTGSHELESDGVVCLQSFVQWRVADVPKSNVASRSHIVFFIPLFFFTFLLILFGFLSCFRLILLLLVFRLLPFLRIANSSWQKQENTVISTNLVIHWQGSVETNWSTMCKLFESLYSVPLILYKTCYMGGKNVVHTQGHFNWSLDAEEQVT